MAAEVPLLLGVAGEWAAPHDALDAYSARAGGPPAWPEGAPPPPAELLACARCGGATSLVMQLYTPLDAATLGAHVSERFLYFFACLAPACRNAPDGWRVLRAQRPAPPPPPPPAPRAVAAAAPPQAAPPLSSDDWGAAGADDWGAGDLAAGAGSAPAGGSELDALAEALRVAAVSGAAADAAALKERQARLDAAAAAAAAANPRRPTPGAATLPEFYVAAVAEPDADGGTALGGGAPREDATSARAAQLAADYARRNTGAGIGDGDAGASGSGGGNGGSGDADADAAGGSAEESWAGEQYERVTVRGVDRAYLRFQKRLRRCPEQCLRYGFGAEPLWPSGRRAAPAPCARCGSARRFEAQLLAPLIHYFGEAPAAAQPGALSDALSDWDWTTVVLHSCAKSCYGSAGGGAADVEYTAEAVWLDSAEESAALRQLVQAAAEEPADAPAPEEA